MLALQFEERVYKRKLNTPKNGKKARRCNLSRNTHGVRRVADLAEDPTAEGFIFPSERVSTPLSLDNMWRRSMQPRLEKVGVSWASFQTPRKTNASLSKKAGVDPMVASDQRGNEIGVSLDVYKRDALSKLEAVVLRKPQPESRLAVGEPGLTA